MARLWFRFTLAAVLGLGLFAAISHLLICLDASVPGWLLPTALGLPVVLASFRRRPEAAIERNHAGRWLTPAVLVLLILLLALAPVTYGAIATKDRSWDGLVHWSLHARALAEDAFLTQPFYQSPLVFSQGRSYPLLQPLCMAGLGQLVGEDLARLFFPFLYVLLLSLVGCTLWQRGAGPWQTWLTVLCLGLTPLFLNPNAGSIDSGYAELFLALAVTAAASGLLLSQAALLGLSAFLLPLIKPEGLPIALLLCLVTAICRSRWQHASASSGLCLACLLWLPIQARLELRQASALTWILPLCLMAFLLGLREVLAPLRRRPWWLLLVLGLLLALGLLLLHGTGLGRNASDLGGSLSLYLLRLPQVLDSLLELPTILRGYAWHLGAVNQFGLLFPLLFLLLLLPRLHLGRCPDRSLGLFLGLAGLLVLLPFLLSPEKDMMHHLRSSMARLILHWVGACWLLVGLWLAPLFSPPACASPGGDSG